MSDNTKKTKTDKKKKEQEKKRKNMNMNVKFPEDDYRELQRIADELGGMTLSSMIRMLVYAKLEDVRKTGDPKAFVDLRRSRKK